MKFHPPNVAGFEQDLEKYLEQEKYLTKNL